MKKNKNEKELLSAYLDGELSHDEKKYIEEQIKSSLELQKELVDLKKLKDLTSSSMDRIPDSPFFETRVLATLNQNQSVKFRFKKWMPVVALSVLTIVLMIVLKLNPNFISNMIEEQKSNIAGFYKENLRPLLYAANLSNEDIFNFAMYQQIPLDSNKQQILKLGYDPQGKEYFEIKRADENKNDQKADNLEKFVSALKLDKQGEEQIDSIINSYSDQLSSLVLVNDKNSVAINPTIWNTRKAILADIISFAQKSASVNFSKIVPNEIANLDVSALTKWADESKNIKDKQYIFFTPDSIFKDDFIFDMAEFKKNMKNMEVEIKNLNKDSKNIKSFSVRIDTTFSNKKNIKNRSQQFKIFADSDFIQVTIQNFNIPDLNIENLKIPDFDFIAKIINESTQNLNIVKPSVPQMPVNSKNYNYESNKTKSKNKIRVDIDLDSLMNLRNLITDSVRSQQLKELQNLNDSLNLNFNYFLNDSLIFMQNNELKKEMDNLRRELKRFRDEMKNYENKSDGKNQNNFREIKNNGVRIIQI
jgi:hypothetical protein